jgi:ATP-dependent DNA ligase
MSFSKEGDVHSLPILRKTSKTSKEMRWKIEVVNNSFYTKSWYHPGGKVKETLPTVCIGKNKGKANETTDADQALFQAYALWLKKKDQQYVEIDNDDKQTFRPMLANKYDKMGRKYLQEPFAVSPKLDGIRAIAYMDEGRLRFTTRNGKEIKWLLLVKEHLNALCQEYNVIFDGELYSHELSFNSITGAVRSSLTASPEDSKIQYYIFDIFTEEKESYLERMSLLKRIEDRYDTMFPFRALKFVKYKLAYHKDVSSYHAQYVSEGYEGLMARELSSPYEIGVRSNYLLKYKEFEDVEFKIIDTSAGGGSEAGAIIFTCEIPQTLSTFTVRPRGSIDKRREMFKLPSSNYIGKYLTVRFQERDPVTNIPRFPVGIEIRDYE